MQNGDCVVLRGNIVEVFWTAESKPCQKFAIFTMRVSRSTYYFSTQGWALGVSCPFFSCLLEPLATAAFLALMSKKLAIVAVTELLPEAKRQKRR